MRVAICYTKLSPEGILNCDAFAEGVLMSGDTVCPIISMAEMGRLAKCDAAVQCCVYNPHGGSAEQTFRRAVEESARRRIVIDGGCLRNFFNLRAADGYLTIGVNGIKSAARYFNSESPPDRWNELGIPLMPWRTEGRHILLLGQTQFGYGTNHMRIPVNEWIQQTARAIRDVTDRPIVLRPHPDEKTRPSVDVADYSVLDRGKLGAALDGAWCCVAKTTYAVVEAILRGIPVITDDPMCVAYPVASHNLADIEAPATPDRTQWACELAYTQWNIDELRQGLPWRHLRPHLSNIT